MLSPVQVVSEAVNRGALHRGRDARVAPVEIGWHLHPDAQGSGYATEAAASVLVDAARNGLSAVIAVTDPRNTASQRVCSRLEMESLGVTNDYYDETNLLFEKSLLQ